MKESEDQRKKERLQEGDGGCEKLREREKNGSVEVIYASCIIFYNAAPPFPYLSLLLLHIPPSHQGVLLLTVTPRNSP